MTFPLPESVPCFRNFFFSPKMDPLFLACWVLSVIDDCTWSGALRSRGCGFRHSFSEPEAHLRTCCPFPQMAKPRFLFSLFFWLFLFARVLRSCSFRPDRTLRRRFLCSSRVSIRSLASASTGCLYTIGRPFGRRFSPQIFFLFALRPSSAEKAVCPLSAANDGDSFSRKILLEVAWHFFTTRILSFDLSKFLPQPSVPPKRSSLFYTPPSATSLFSYTFSSVPSWLSAMYRGRTASASL